jgi:hypothetical protein
VAGIYRDYRTFGNMGHHPAIDEALQSIGDEIARTSGRLAGDLAAGESVDMVAEWAVPIPARATGFYEFRRPQRPDVSTGARPSVRESDIADRGPSRQVTRATSDRSGPD